MFKKQLRTFICKLLFFILEMQKYTFFFNWKGFFVFIKKKKTSTPDGGPHGRPYAPADGGCHSSAQRLMPSSRIATTCMPRRSRFADGIAHPPPGFPHPNGR